MKRDIEKKGDHPKISRNKDPLKKGDIEKGLLTDSVADLDYAAKQIYACVLRFNKTRAHKRFYIGKLYCNHVMLSVMLTHIKCKMVTLATSVNRMPKLCKVLCWGVL